MILEINLYNLQSVEIVYRICSNVAANPEDIKDLVFHWANKNDLI